MSESKHFDGESIFVAAFAGLLVGFAVGTLLGQFMGNQEIRKEAVKTGVARYVAAEDGGSKFEWIVPTEKR